MAAGSNRLLIEPMCGLGNRMRVIDSGLQWKHMTGGQLHVLWFVNSDVGIPFTDLFEVPSGVDRLHQWRMPRRLETIVKRFLHSSVRGIGYAFKDHEEVESRCIRGDFQQWLLAQRRVFLKTYTDFLPHEDSLRVFRPVSRLQQAVHARLPRLRRAVGVHVRRSDHKDARRLSTSERFIARMQGEIERDASTQFYLATDSAEEEARLVGLFGDRVFTHPKRSLNRGDREAIEDAVIDMYSLSNCRRILGSFGSSFTEAAGKIGGVPVEIVAEPPRVAVS